MSKGIDRITGVVKTANKTIKEGQAVVQNAEKAWNEIGKVFEDSKALVKSAKEKYAAFQEKWGTGDIGSQILAASEAKKDIGKIIDEVNDIKTKVLDIYATAKEMKEQVTSILDNLKFVIAELKKWKEIKKEIEQQLIDAKMEVVKAIATCKKLASQKYQEAKSGLDGLITTVGNMDLATMTKGGKKEILKQFEKVMEDYDWWTSGGEEQVKDLKKAIKKSVTEELERILDGAISYVEQSKSWQRVERLVTSITDLQETLDGIFNKANTEEAAGESLTRQLKKLGEKLITSTGEQAAKLLGKLIEPAGPAFELVGKFLKAYKLADSAIEAAKNFPEGLDAYLPKTYSKDFVDWKKTLFSYSIDIPIASLGWISLTAGVKLSSGAEFKLSGSITFYNTFKPEELKVLDGSLTASGKISLTGSVSLGVNLLMIVEAKATASLTAEGLIKDATAQINILRKLSGDAKKGAVKLGGTTTLAFEVYGALSFSVGLTSALRTVVRWFTRKDPVVTWELGRLSLFTAETTKNFSTSIKFKAVEFDFSEVKELLKSISTYRLSPAGRKNIEESISTQLGKKDKWEEYAKGAKLTDEELDQLREKYGKVTV